MLAAVLMLTAAAVPAFASDHQNSAFEFQFNWAKNSDATGGRSKTDSTPVYVKTTWIPANGYQVFVDGYSSSGGWVDNTVRTAYIQDTGEGIIRSYVHENGYKTARLRGYKAFANTYASGVWSPDSVGSYSNVYNN